MSANDMDDEFGVTEDLEDLLAPAAKPARKASAAAPRATKEGDTTVGSSGAVVLTPEQLEELKNSLRSEIEADLRAEIEKSPKSPQIIVNNSGGQPIDNRPIDNRPTAPPEEGDPETGVRVHFIDDGFTLGARVFYRGEEFVAPADSPWARLTASQQTVRYGKQLFRQGPWDGADFDLNDPALTEDDRAKLLEIMAKRQAAEPVTTR